MSITQDLNAQAINTLNTSTGSIQQVQKSNIMMNEKATAPAGLDSLRNLANRTYKQLRDKEERERVETEATQQAEAEMRASAGEELPEGASPVARERYDAVSYMQTVDESVNTLTDTFGSEDFLVLSKENQKAELDKAVDQIIKGVGGTTFEKNVGVLQYAGKKIRNLRTEYQNAITEYNTRTLPQKIMIKQVNMLVESNADKDAWASRFKVFQQPEQRLGLEKSEVAGLMYGEVSRAMEAGNLASYDALRDDPLYDRLSSNQRNMLDKGYVSALKTQENELVNNTVNSIKSQLINAIATGNSVDVDNTLMELKGQNTPITNRIIAKLGAPLREHAKLQGALAKYQQMEYDPRVRLNEKEIDSVYTTMSRSERNMTQGFEDDALARGVATTPISDHVKLGQATTAIKLFKKGQFTKTMTEGFQLGSMIFSNQELTPTAKQAIENFELAKKAGLGGSELEQLAGNDYQLMKAIETKRKGAVDLTTATALATEELEARSARTPAQKEIDAVKAVQAIDYSSLGTRIYDDFADLSSPVNFWSDLGESRLDKLLVSDPEFTSQAVLDEDFIDEKVVHAFAGILGDDMPTDITNAKIKGNVTASALIHNDVVTEYPDLSEAEQIEITQERLKTSTLAINGQILADKELFSKIKRITGADEATSFSASKYTSLAVQSMTPMAMLAPVQRDAIIDEVMIIETMDENGNYTPVTDHTLRARAYSEYKRGNDRVHVRADLDRYNDIMENGLTRNGEKILNAPLSMLVEQTGLYDSGLLGGQLPASTVGYDSDYGITLQLMNRSGGALTVDEPLIQEFRNKVSKAVGGIVPEGGQISARFTDDILLAFVRSYKARGE